MPTEHEIFRAVQRRAEQRATRTDYRQDFAPLDLPPPLPASLLEAAQADLSTTLHPFHARLFREIADGGFGPGFGLVGVRPRGADTGLVPLAHSLCVDLPGVVPLCDWGSGLWSGVDSVSGEAIALDESGARSMGMSIVSMFERWASGENLLQSLVMVEEYSEVRNPFTGAPMRIPRRVMRPLPPYRPGGPEDDDTKPRSEE